ncbi:MAG: HD domain-containing protein [Cellulosilyticaceae bacterium]
MKYSATMFRCIKYIENHIKEPLTAGRISEEVGYSLFHLSHIFKEEMGMSMMEYVKERRLICASQELSEGKKIIDIAMDYGYQTHSGFSKAFKKQFGFPPTFIHAMYMSCNVFNQTGGSKHMSFGEEGKWSVFIKQYEDFTESEVLYTNLLQTMEANAIPYDLEKVECAYKMACVAHRGEKRKSGEDYIIHPLCVANILADMEVGEACIIAGLLHEILEKNTAISIEVVEKTFSQDIAEIILGVTELNQVKLEELQKKAADWNPDCILIKLADRLHNMRTIKYMEADRLKEKAKETIAFFTPIAIKLGNEKVKRELDDLALRYL